MKKTHMLPKSLVTPVLAGLIALSTGCASIVHNRDRKVQINSQPEGATVTISNPDTKRAVHTGKTPLTVSLEPKRGFFKGQSYTVRLELDGYQTDEITLKPEISGWYFGNIVFGGLIGLLIVDPATGAMWNISPDKIDRPLTREQASLIRQGNGLLVVLLAETTDLERVKMQKIN